MIPTAFAAAYTVFPKRAQGMVMALVGLTVTLAPTIGPTIGGYPDRALLLALAVPDQRVPGHRSRRCIAWTLVDFDKPDYALLRGFDFIGLASMAVFLGSLEYVLEEGQRERLVRRPRRSSPSPSLRRCWRACVFFCARADARETPIVDLRAFREPQLRGRLGADLRARDRALRAHLSLSALPGAGARLHVAADRRDGVRHRRLHVPGGADRRARWRAGSTRGG